jgi:uncharacterized protein
MATVSYVPRRRRWPTYLLVGFLVGALAFTLLAGLVVEVLWYNEIHQPGVFWHTLWTKVLLGVLFGAVFFGLLYANLVIARRLRPDVTIVPNPLDPLERFRTATEPFLRWLLPLGCFALAFLVALSVSGNWQTFLLWRNSGGVAFGNPEPLFGRDPAFYIFQLPWLRFLQGWLFSSLVGVTLLVAVAYAVWGGIRPQAPGFADKVTPAARAHLSVLLGLVMLVKAWGYWLGRFDLLTSARGIVEGASYTDVKAQLPALNFLAIVAIICAVLFFLNIRTKQWSLPIVAVALLAIVSVLLGTAYPAFIQQFKVKPNEQQLEQPYIEYNITATRDAFGLEQIEQQQRDVTGALTARQLRQNRTTVSNIRLWRPSTLRQNFQSFQRVREYYDFLDVDVDRYPIGVGGSPRVIMVSAREVNPEGIPQAAQTWQNVHLAYTHGFGAVGAQVNTATTEGQPVLTLQDLPPVGSPAMTQPRIYYGESGQGDFVVANANGELDYEGATENAPYSGQGGIPIENIFRRALFAWNFRDVNLLLSGQITGQSRLMIYRDIEERAAKAVPFLSFDADPYFAIVDGRPVWILDAYTGSNGYPYSQAVSASAATDGLLFGQYNYIRNSVKVMVDAYDGTVTYYADLSEPIAQVWNNAYPGLFSDITTAPADLKAHFRYPENLFQVQAYQFANYHVSDPTTFYQRRDFWQVSPDPTQNASAISGSLPPMRPYYQLIKVPGGTTEQFQLVVPFVPAGRQNMVAWMAASSDPADYGHVTLFRFPEGRNIEGPQQVFARINNDPRFSSERTLLSQQGSQLFFGDFLVIPIDNSFLYVLPVYVQSSEGAQIPELKRVVVVNGSGGDVSLGQDLPRALSEATGQSGGTGSGGGGSGGTGGGAGGLTPDQQIQVLLAQALQHFAAAQDALRTGDLALYQQELEKAQSLIQQANQLAAGQAGTSTSPTPSPGVTPSPTAAPSPSG